MRKYFNFIYLQDRNFIFAYVPKVACTNWKCLLRHMSGYEDYSDSHIAHNRNRCGLTFVSDIDNKEQVLFDDNIMKYTFVRDPFSRILSAYLNKVEFFSDNPDKEIWDPHFSKLTKEIDAWRRIFCPEEITLNFYSFLMWIKHSGHIHASNEHWIPQAELLHLNEIKYDFIGRFENISEDSKKLLALMGCAMNFPTQEEVKFKPHNASSKLGTYYSEREMQLIRDIYKEDFELLGYSMNS